MQRMRIALRATHGPRVYNILETPPYIFVVLSSTQHPHNEVSPQSPAHTRRLLSSHAVSKAMLMPKSFSHPFDHTLAKSLNLARHCLPLLSLLSSHEHLGMIFHLSARERELLLEKFLTDFNDYRPLVKRNKIALESLEEQYNVIRYIVAFHVPIHHLPVELLTDIFLISVEELGVTQNALQNVCRNWRALVRRLWGTLRVGTWADERMINSVINRNPLSLAVVIDTAFDEALSPVSKIPYAALALAWTSASRWSSLAINSFPNNRSIYASDIPVCPTIPFKSLESLSIGPGCDSSDHINGVIEVVVLTASPKLTRLMVAASTVFQRLNQPHCIHIYSQLTFLEVKVTNMREPVDLLCHCTYLEALKLSGVLLHPLPPEVDLPLFQTLRQLWLQKASVQWIGGHTFTQLERLVLLRPVDPHSITCLSTIYLPRCTTTIIQSHSLRLLAAFRAPIMNDIKIDCNEWRKARANPELGRIWSRKLNHAVLRPRALSLKIPCGDRVLVEALGQIDMLEDLTLNLPHPSALGVSFFQEMCAEPMSPFTGRTKEEWMRWAHGGTLWQAKICPSLVKLRLQYERWLRGGEMDISLLFLAVDWSRKQLASPLQEFDFRLGKDNALHMPETISFDIAYMCSWQHTSDGKLRLDEQHEMFFISCFTAAINRFIGFDERVPVFPLPRLQSECYGTVFNHLRTFRYHPSKLPPRPYNILPFFKHLEVLDVSNLHFEPCPPTASLPLCRTLRILHIRNTPLDWMNGRIFKRVIKCMIVVDNGGHIGKLTRVEMPACTTMDFDGPDDIRILESFRLPSVYPPLKLPRPPEKSALVQDIALPVQSLGPPQLQAHTKAKDENIVSALPSEVIVLPVRPVRPISPPEPQTHMETTEIKNDKVVSTLQPEIGAIGAAVVPEEVVDDIPKKPTGTKGKSFFSQIRKVLSAPNLVRKSK